MKKKPLKEGIKTIYKLANIPDCALPDIISLHIYDNKKFILDCPCEIVKYDDSVISLKTRKFIVSFFGENLCITSLKSEAVCAEGDILKVEYINL